MKKRIVKFDYNLFEKYVNEKNFDAKKIYEYLGMARWAVSRWRSGKVEPRCITLYMVADLLNVPMEKFFTDEYIDVPDGMDNQEALEYLKQARYENPFEGGKMYDSLKDDPERFKLKDGMQKVNYVNPFKDQKSNEGDNNVT